MRAISVGCLSQSPWTGPVSAAPPSLCRASVAGVCDGADRKSVVDVERKKEDR